jgi:hypothetical protein
MKLIRKGPVAQLVDELGVFGQLELPDAMRLEPMRAPDALHRGNADAGGLGHRRARPCHLVMPNGHPGDAFLHELD